jgi:hypothetical protein
MAATALPAPCCRSDDGVDFRGGLLGARGQAAHFIGDHGETAPGLAGPRRFDRGVEGEQVGRLGAALDHSQGAIDLLAVQLQQMDHLAALLHFAGQGGDRLAGLFDQLQAAAGFQARCCGCGRAARLQ